MSAIFCRLPPVIAAGSCRGSGCQAQKYECGFHSERTTNNEGQLRLGMQAKLKYWSIVNAGQTKNYINILQEESTFLVGSPEDPPRDKMPTSGKFH